MHIVAYPEIGIDYKPNHPEDDRYYAHIDMPGEFCAGGWGATIDEAITALKSDLLIHGFRAEVAP